MTNCLGQLTGGREEKLKKSVSRSLFLVSFYFSLPVCCVCSSSWQQLLHSQSQHYSSVEICVFCSRPGEFQNNSFLVSWQNQILAFNFTRWSWAMAGCSRCFFLHVFPFFCQDLSLEYKTTFFITRRRCNSWTLGLGLGFENLYKQKLRSSWSTLSAFLAVSRNLCLFDFCPLRRL